MRVRWAQLWRSRAVGSQNKPVPTGLRPELETNPSLALHSLSESQPRWVPSELCLGDACSLAVCTQSPGRTGQGSPEHNPGTLRAASQLGEGRVCVGCGSATSCRRPCLCTHVHCLLTAGGVHKTSRCISPWRPDSLPSVGTLRRSLLSGQASSGPSSPGLCCCQLLGVSCSASSGSLLGGQEGGVRALGGDTSFSAAAESPLSVGLVSPLHRSKRRSGSQKEKGSESWLGLC